MHVVFRLFFWLSLAATCLVLVAPVLSGADWDVVQPTAFVGLAVTLLLTFASARVVPSAMATDPVATAKRRRGSGIAYAIILMVVLGPVSLIALTEAQQDLRNGEGNVSEIETRMREGLYASPFAKTLADDQVASAEAGETTAFVGLGVVGLALIGLIAAATRKAPQGPQPLFQTSGAPYQAIVMAPYQQTYPQQTYPQQTYPQQAHPQQAGHIWNENTFG